MHIAPRVPSRLLVGALAGVLTLTLPFTVAAGEPPRLPPGFTPVTPELLPPGTITTAPPGVTAPCTVPQRTSDPVIGVVGNASPYPGNTIEHRSYGGYYDPCESPTIGQQWIRGGTGLGYGSPTYQIRSGDVGTYIQTQTVACNSFGCSSPPSLSNLIWPTSSPSPPPPPPPSGGGFLACDSSPGVYLYDHTDYNTGGRCWRFTANANLAGTAAENVASSIRLVGNYAATVFAGGNYSGAWHNFTSDSPSAFGWYIGNDTASSVAVHVVNTAPACFAALSEATCQQIPDPGDPPLPDRPPNRGGKWLDLQGQVRGSRAGIQAGPNAGSLPFLSAAIMRVAVEVIPKPTKIVQVGFGRTLRKDLGSCGTSPVQGKFYNVWEYRNPSTLGYECGWASATQLGKSQLYSVFQRSGASWRIKLNDTTLRDVQPGFSAGDRALAGGEIVNTAGLAFDRPDGAIYGCYGCSATPSGVVPWQRTASSGNSGWVTINSANNILDGSPSGATSTNRWTVGSLPGPFAVQHACDGRHGCSG